MIRLDFEPTPDVEYADWQGSAFIDSATSALVRIDFHLAGLTEFSRPRRLEGYTTFVSPSPYFVIPDSTVAGWWKAPPGNDGWGIPDVVQSIHVTSIEYRKARPVARPLTAAPSGSAVDHVDAASRRGPYRALYAAKPLTD